MESKKHSGWDRFAFRRFSGKRFPRLQEYFTAFGAEWQPTFSIFLSIRQISRSRVKFSHSTHSRTIDFSRILIIMCSMEEQDALAMTIGKNLTRLRKMANMTQLELAEKLNYSDKSVSKWEQGNGIPDVRILVQLADLFGVTLDDLVRDYSNEREQVMPKKTKRIQRLITVLLSAGLCWLVAVVVFVLIGIFAPSFSYKWMTFVYAVPATAIVVLVFSCIWQYKWIRVISISVLVWSILASVYLTAYLCGQNIWLVFLIGIPLQVLALFFFVWRKGAHFKES